MAQAISAAESSQPALVLDIDGVFNAWSGDTPPAQDYKRRPDDLGYGVYYNPGHAVWLRRLHATSADLYYISDLQHDAHTHMSVVHDIPEFDWIDVDPYLNRAPSYAAARAMAIGALLGERPVAWIDDRVTETEFRWAEARSAEGAPTLVVKTELATGLQPEQMTSVEDWLAKAARR